MQTRDDSTQPQLPCRHLRCKEMFHESPQDDAFASGIFWCAKTQEPFGPDGLPADKKHCCEARTCFLG